MQHAAYAEEGGIVESRVDVVSSLGVDLASRAEKTGVCVVAWTRDGAASQVSGCSPG